MVDYQVIAYGVHGQGGEGVGVAHVVHLIAVGQVLQLAVSAGLAEHAEVIVFRKDKLQYLTAVLLQLFAVGTYYQPLPGRVGAGGHRPSLPVNLDDAQAAGPDIAQAVEVAQRGDVDAVGLTDLKNGVAGLPFNLPVVDG